jgi:endonuclease YncB( thermonuclease family)
VALYVKFRADVGDVCFVSHVLDGDGVIAQTAGGTVIVRLWGIDAPEMNQRGGRASREFLRGLVYSKTCVMRRHAQDNYGRVVAELDVDGVGSVSVAMVRAGWAWWYRRFAWGHVALHEAEKLARADRRGLWQEGNPAPPWNYRQRRASKPG